MKLLHILSFGFVVIGSLWFYSCGGSSQSNTYKIAVTIAPIESLIKGIASPSYQGLVKGALLKEHLEVKVLLPDGTIPENYEPTIETIAYLEQCDAWYYVGDLGFESMWIEKVKEINPEIKLVRLDEGLKHIFVEHSHGETSHSIADPHYWVSVEGMETMRNNLYKALSEVFPKEDLNEKAWLDDIAVMREKAKLIKADNERQKSEGHKPAVIVYHPALTYYASELGMEQWVIELHGKEPTAQHMADLSRKWAPKAGMSHSAINAEGGEHAPYANPFINPKLYVLKEYKDISVALSKTYGLTTAYTKDENPFVLNAFHPSIWDTMYEVLYYLPSSAYSVAE